VLEIGCYHWAGFWHLGAGLKHRVNDIVTTIFTREHGRSRAAW